MCATSSTASKPAARPVANAEVMYRSMTTVHAANICMWLKRDLKFDPRQGGIRQRPGSQPPALPRDARTVDHLTFKPNPKETLSCQYRN